MPDRDASASELLWGDARLILPHGAVHVWALGDAPVRQAASTFAHLLADDERQRARAYRRATDAVLFSGRRGALRWLAARYTGVEPAALCFANGASGRPALHGAGPEEYALSVARTDGMTLFAFARSSCVGVDVERIGRRFDHVSVARGIFSGDEQHRLETAADAAPEFLRTWTRKEAWLKALGSGLTDAARHYSTEADASAGDGRWRVRHADALLEGWMCIDLALGALHCGALAHPLPHAGVSLFICP